MLTRVEDLPVKHRNMIESTVFCVSKNSKDEKKAAYLCLQCVHVLSAF